MRVRKAYVDPLPFRQIGYLFEAFPRTDIQLFVGDLHERGFRVLRRSCVFLTSNVAPHALRKAYFVSACSMKSKWSLCLLFSVCFGGVLGEITKLFRAYGNSGFQLLITE
jgi:hypothetical protein